MTWSRSASGTRSASLAACVSQLWRPLCCRGNASGQRGGHCCASLLPPETVTTAAAVASPHHLGPAFHPPQIESVISFLAVTWLGATADVLSGGRVWFLDAAITLALCAVFGVVGVVGLCVDARSGCCGRGGAAGERTPLKT